MAHLRNSTKRSTMAAPEWLGVGRAIGQLVNGWSLRNDIVAYVGPDAGSGSAACYNPALAEVEVDVAQAFGKMTTPEQVGDFTQRDRHYEFPRATGAILHEAFHARFSGFPFDKIEEALNAEQTEAFLLLEEGRIEHYGVRSMPDARAFLRASAFDIVIDDAADRINEQSSVKSAAMLVALVHARVEAGIIEPHEIESIDTIVRKVLGDAVVERLLSIIRRAQAHDRHTDPEPMYDLAREWVEVVNEAMRDAGESADGDGAVAALLDAMGGDGEGEVAKALQEMMEAMRDAADDIAIANHDALAEQQEKEEWKREAEQRASDGKQRDKNAEVAREVFGGSSTGEVKKGGSLSTVVERRMPTADERRAAVIISTMLEKAKYRERDEMEIASAIPPGRLRTRALVQGRALRERGVIAAAQPWRRTVRKHTDDPTLSIGVMVDISGSMVAAMNPMATTAWVMSEVARRVQGKCAMVYYGNDVFPTLRPGQHLDEVTVYDAKDNTEKFDKAFRALDGALNLTEGTGARLLVVVSDGHYTSKEEAEARAAIQRCYENGVAVLWLPFRPANGTARSIVGRNGTVVDVVNDPAAAADEIGRAAADALTAIGERR